MFIVFKQILLRFRSGEYYITYKPRANKPATQTSLHSHVLALFFAVLCLKKFCILAWPKPYLSIDQNIISRSELLSYFMKFPFCMYLIT